MCVCLVDCSPRSTDDATSMWPLLLVLLCLLVIIELVQDCNLLTTPAVSLCHRTVICVDRPSAGVTSAISKFSVAAQLGAAPGAGSGALSISDAEHRRILEEEQRQLDVLKVSLCSWSCSCQKRLFYNYLLWQPRICCLLTKVTIDALCLCGIFDVKQV